MRLLSGPRAHDRRRSDPPVGLALSGHRGGASARACPAGRRRADAGPAAARRRTCLAVARRAREANASVADRRDLRDDRDRRAARAVGSAQALRQGGVLGEDDRALRRARVYLRGAQSARTPQSCDWRNQQGSSLRIHRALADGRRRRSLDRLFLAYFGGSEGSAPSRGAPVPLEPKKTFCPFGNVMSRPFALQMGVQLWALL